MKRFNCTLSDKRGEFGECMEAHNTGRYVLFSDVEKLQRRMQEMLEKSNSTGLAINKAILSGFVPEKHPLRSRLELLANHHKREQAFADGMVVMADRCQLLTDLLKEVTQVIPAIGVTTDDMPVVDAFLERIEAALAGQVLGHVGNNALAMMMDELHDFCVGLDTPGGAQSGSEAWDLVKAARDRVLACLHQGRPDAEWTDATTSPVAADYRELQAQHDQVQSRLKVALDIVRDLVELPYSTGGVIVRLEVRERARDLLAGQVPALVKGRTITEGQEFELTAVLQSIANGFSDDPAHDAVAMLKRIAGEVPWTGDSFQLPPRQGGEPCDSASLSSSPA